MIKPILDVESVSVQYADKSILQDVSFTVGPGEVVSLIGRSGVGKTTLLNAIAGFLPYTGIISRPDNLGYVFQKNQLFPFMRVAENISFGLGQLPRNERKSEVSRILELIGLAGYEKKFPAELSGGQAQRVALGQVLVKNPALVLLDEAFSALDIITRDQMGDWLHELIHQLNTSVLLVTHYLDEAILLSHRVIVIRRQGSTPFVLPPVTNRFDPEFIRIKQQLNALLLYE